MGKSNKKKMKGWLIIALCVVGAAALYFAYYMSGIISYKNKVKNTVIPEVNISAIPDGTYIGDYDVNILYAKVEVIVKSGEITDIILIEHRHDHGERAERVTDDIIAEQSLDVDAVSGATNSSTVIKKAVSNALQSADNGGQS